MRQHWLTVVRILLRSLKRAQNSKPDNAELEQLHIKIHQTHEQAGSENVSIIADLVMSDENRDSTRCMVLIFDLLLKMKCCRADACSKHVASLLKVWLVEDLLQPFTDIIKIERKPKLRIQNDSYSYDIQPELTMVSRRKMNSAERCLHTSVIVRKERTLGTLITSAELYTLFSMAANQASAQPSRDSLEVRMLVVYSRWVQIFTAKTTQRYVTSVIEGWNEIADQMEIYQTPWLDFTDISNQQQILLFALERIKLQSPIIKKQWVPIEDMQSSIQNSSILKRKLDAREEQSDKRPKKEHKRDRAKEKSALV